MASLFILLEHNEQQFSLFFQKPYYPPLRTGDSPASFYYIHIDGGRSGGWFAARLRWRKTGPEKTSPSVFLLNVAKVPGITNCLCDIQSFHLEPAKDILEENGAVVKLKRAFVVEEENHACSVTKSRPKDLDR